MESFAFPDNNKMDKLINICGVAIFYHLPLFCEMVVKILSELCLSSETPNFGLHSEENERAAS